jgi:hypothetical protein
MTINNKFFQTKMVDRIQGMWLVRGRIFHSLKKQASNQHNAALVK